MTAWPNTLPEAPLLDQFRESAPDTVIRTNMDQGPAKVRQRTTAAVRLMSMTYLLSKAQVETLEEFYLTTLQGGSGRFDFTHPRTGDSVSCRFVSPPEYGAVNGNYFKVNVALEALP